MHLHILGICGTFMAGLAEIGVQLGHRVTGSDNNVYPPMSTFLNERGIDIQEGYGCSQFDPRPDLVIIGNALSRGNEAVEYVLREHLPYNSGAQWLAEEVLRGRHVLAVSGTHGKTTTTSMLAFILARNGLDPGYLIGGIAQDFGSPATLGTGACFVIEADEYDTAFFDKRSKFVHYRPDTLIINNLEFDHADIFPDLDAIKTQFHHLLRTVPSTGLVLFPAGDPTIADVIGRGCWCRTASFGFDRAADLRITAPAGGATEFALTDRSGATRPLHLNVIGRHNALNAAAAIRAAMDVGVSLDAAATALSEFGGVKRRLEIIGTVNGVTLYDDFAHHPTAIEATLEALRGAAGDARILCVLEPRSNTMRLGVHTPALANSLQAADAVYLYAPQSLEWDPQVVLQRLGRKGRSYAELTSIITDIRADAEPGDHIVIMSNGGFGGLHRKLLDALA